MKTSSLVGQFCAFFSAVTILSSCASGGSGGGPTANTLSVGLSSTAPASVDLKPQFAGLMNYNGKTTEDLFSLRKQNVNFHPELLQGPYSPSPQVFTFDTKSPWWSLKGYLFRGNNLNPTEGMSRESPYFGNPFMLISPEWYCTNLHWSDQRFPNAQSFADSYPLYQQPTALKVFPKEKREEIDFDIMGYYNTVRSLVGNSLNIPDMQFDLNAYNAEDFGYNYVYVDPDQSQKMGKLPPDVIKIDQTLMVRHRETCAQACNDIDSPDGMKGFKVNDLPAKCHLLLWKNKPKSHLVSPDFTVDLVFK